MLLGAGVALGVSESTQLPHTCSLWTERGPRALLLGDLFREGLGTCWLSGSVQAGPISLRREVRPFYPI